MDEWMDVWLLHRDSWSKSNKQKALPLLDAHSYFLLPFLTPPNPALIVARGQATFVADRSKMDDESAKASQLLLHVQVHMWRFK
jgi:hypothetical protein